MDEIDKSAQDLLRTSCLSIYTTYPPKVEIEDSGSHIKMQAALTLGLESRDTTGRS
jgi:hypothetical protein